MRGGILIVEDAVDTRELLAELLMHEGYHSIMAASGAEALRRMEGVAPDLIITDLAMPEMNGARLVAHVRHNPALREIPVLLLTGSGQDAAESELSAAGASVTAILAKPVNLRVLLDAIARTLDEPPIRHAAP
ncbi:MAG: response regulator [Bacteroidota bacterium]